MAGFRMQRSYCYYYYMTKETYYMTKETYYMTKETYYMTKETYGREWQVFGCNGPGGQRAEA